MIVLNFRLALATGTGTYSTEKIEKEAGYTVSVPAGFEVSSSSGETKQSDGVVLKDTNDNEYVWVPVNDAIYDGVTSIPTSTSSTSTYKPMAETRFS